jgi:molybdopterin molybdotransferase
MAQVATCSFSQARQIVTERVKALRKLESEAAPFAEAAGRVLAEDIPADRDYPPADRSIRDGFAVRSQDLPGALRVIGEVRAGANFDGVVGPGEAVEIMTGAPVPSGADQVVMVEHTTREGGLVATRREPSAGEFINRRGCEIRSGEAVLPAGRRIGYAEAAALATVGRLIVRVFLKPRVAILSTGDEVVPIQSQPEANQVRNSNAWSVAVQVRRAGGIPEVLPVTPDDLDITRRRIGEGLGYDLLLLSGGVSAGKYDCVEKALADFGAEFYFNRVLIQPGQPLVFGRARGVFFFGLPGNPASTMVTFEVFARAAVELLGGQTISHLPMPWARLTREFSHKPGLTRFLPARLSDDGGEVTPVPWQGSSDVAALARANAFLVADAERERWGEGDMIRVLLR